MARRLIIFVISLAAGAAPPAGAARLAGEVYDARTARTVAVAQLEMDGERTLTGADGGFKFVGTTGGRHELVASASGYAVTVLTFIGGGEGESWHNVPLMPLGRETPGAGDFFDLFFREAPLYELYSGYTAARRLDDLPWRVRVSGAGENLALLEERIRTLNERWGTDIFAFAADGEAADVELAFNAGADAFEVGRNRARASFAGPADEPGRELAASFLRRVVLGAGPAAAITAQSLSADGEEAADLDAVVEIIYREPEDFNYGVFRKRRPSPISVLADLGLAIGGYGRHGIRDAGGVPVHFPLEYQLGQVSVASGLSYERFWAKAGWWFAGIWNANAEAAYANEVNAAEVLRRNHSDYYRGGVYWWRTDAIKMSAFGGYRRLAVRGKFVGGEAKGSPWVVAPVVMDYTTHYDGAEAGVDGAVVTGWRGLAFRGEYSRVFSHDPYNVGEFGVGAVNRLGVGTLVFVRYYWGEWFNYTFGGVELSFDVGI